MEAVETLIVGAGMSGLATAAALQAEGKSDYLLLEAAGEIGGYCRTVKRDGFVWDYSGHFFHFKHKDIEQWLVSRMGDQAVRTVERRAFIRYRGRQIDFPFQKNIHQLPHDEFLECLVDLYLARAPAELLGRAVSATSVPERNFREMLYARFGRAISEKFLVPYNEKLYSCDLSRLDRDAMGRFFPHADLTDIILNMRPGSPEPARGLASKAGYNATFTYPEGGAIEYVKALASAVRPGGIALSEPVVSIDLEARVAVTSRRRLRFERLVSSAPLPRLLAMCGLAVDPSFTWNQVLVFNLGFDRKGPSGVHWLYFPEKEPVFYRLGFYDNIFDTDRMSLYVEVAFPGEAVVDVAATRARVLEGLRAAGIVTDHQLVAEHLVLMNPAYVHLTPEAEGAREAALGTLSAKGVHSIGRYGHWTYCSMEDNIVEARATVASFSSRAP